MAKKELIAAKQEKAQERIKNFRGELADYRQTMEHLRKDREDSVSMTDVIGSYKSQSKGLSQQ